jgi:hypothetical protein
MMAVSMFGRAFVVTGLALAMCCMVPLAEVRADQPGYSPKGYSGSSSARSQPYRVAPRSGIGGYSLSLSDVWGPAEMPPTPRDFGPHFDFQPSPLHGGIGTAPYPGAF